MRGAGAGLLMLLPCWKRSAPSFAPAGGLRGAGAGLRLLLFCWMRSTPFFAPAGGVRGAGAGLLMLLPCWPAGRGPRPPPRPLVACAELELDCGYYYPAGRGPRHPPHRQPQGRPPRGPLTMRQGDGRLRTGEAARGAGTEHGGDPARAGGGPDGIGDDFAVSPRDGGVSVSGRLRVPTSESSSGGTGGPALKAAVLGLKGGR